jgi:hypothetical protein
MPLNSIRDKALVDESPMIITRSLFAILLLMLGVDSASAADSLAPARDRFQKADAQEVADFQRHIVPLLGKVGCNGRACHGSFQGQGGLRLSLFGYDFKMDHEGLAERLDLDEPAKSYAVEKATLATPHKGGKRFDLGSWEYNAFLSWIKGGAKGTDEPLALKGLDITPKEIQFATKGQTQPLKVIAHWADGSSEDVTCLCRFQSNDPQVCEISKEGVVTANESGDTHVVAFYDRAVVPIAVIRPVSDQIGPNYPKIAAKTKVDELVVAKLAKLGIVPSEEADDAEFLRRVSLDMTGTLPSADEVRHFLADSTPDKRAKKIDELLETPAYAAWWTTKFCDWTGNSDTQLNNVGFAREAPSAEWYSWLYKRVSENVSYDNLISGIVLANSRKPDESYTEFCKRESDRIRNEGADGFAKTDGLTYFWGRRNFVKPEDRAIGFAYTFLGLRIQCAQCHKHPFDQWSQDDFKQFENFFTRIRYSQNGSDKKEYDAVLAATGLDTKLKGNDLRKELPKALKDGKTCPMPELYVTKAKLNVKPKKEPKANAKKYTGPDFATAKLLGGEVVKIDEIEDPRVYMMEWLRKNPLFAKAFVNRVWSGYFNRGIVEPTDDMNLANPPCNAELLDYLAKGFVESGYDMKWVHRTIANSRTYQTSWKPNSTNTLDERNFSRSVPRRLPAEVTVDAVAMATSSDERAATFRNEIKTRAVSIPSTPRNNNMTGSFYALNVFGRSIRESNCDCDRSGEASLLQTLYLRNDGELHSAIDRNKEGWLATVAQEMKIKFTPAAPSREGRDQAMKETARPADFNDVVARFQKQIERAKKENPKRAARAEQLLAEYLKKYPEKAAPKAKPMEKPAPEPAKEALANVDKIVEEIYLRTVNRYPTKQEAAIAADYVKTSTDTIAGIRGLLWAMLNTKEFIVNH